MFKHIETKIIRPFAKTDHDESGHYYITNEGKRYPSITTVLKMLDTKEWYGYWVTSIAKKENISESQAKVRCKEIGDNSIKMGNIIHKYAEDYLNNSKYVPLKSAEDIENINPADLFQPLMTHLASATTIGTIYGVEKSIYSDDLELAGTVDCIAEYEGVLSIIDFKNSRKRKTKSECAKKDYFVQMCAYGKMWEFCTGQKIKQGVNIIINWDETLTVFKVKLDDYEVDLMRKLVFVEQQQALNTT